MPRKSSKKTQNCANPDGPSGFLLRRAITVLRRGGVVVHATEGVFGLAASALNETACDRVAGLKRRPRHKRFIVIAASGDDIARLVHLDGPLQETILTSWPGPTTWILPARDDIPAWLRDRRGRLAVRLTGHPQAAALCRAAGPLISTSANPPGRAPARSLFAARRYFGDAVDLYLPGRLGAAPGPSTIRDGASGRVLRN